jgi:hypothetical protein
MLHRSTTTTAQHARPSMRASSYQLATMRALVLASVLNVLCHVLNVLCHVLNVFGWQLGHA